MGEKGEKSKAEKLYDILQNDQHYKDVLPDKETFVNKLQDEKFANKFHSILMNDNRYNTVIPDYNTFYKSMQIPVSTTEAKTVTNNSEITEPPEDWQEKYEASRKWALDHLEELKQAEKENPEKYGGIIDYYTKGVLRSKLSEKESAAEVSVRDKTPIEKLGRPILWREEEKAIKESSRNQWNRRAPEISPPLQPMSNTLNAEGVQESTSPVVKETPRQPSAILPSAAELSLETVLRNTPVKKMESIPFDKDIMKERPLERNQRKMAKEYFTSPQVKERLAASGAITEEEKKVTIPEGGVAVAMLTSKYPKGYDPTKYLPKSDAFSLDNIMALTDGMDYYIEADKKIRNTSYNKFFGPVAESEQNAEKRGEARTVKGLNDQEFIEMIDKYNKDPKIESWRKLTDDEKAALIIDRRKRQAAGYFDFKNNLNSNILNEDLEQCTGDKVCRSNTSFNALNQLKQFRKHNKQTIIKAYKDLNPGKEFTKEMEAEVDDYLKLLEEEKNSNLQSK